MELNLFFLYSCWVFPLLFSFLSFLFFLLKIAELPPIVICTYVHTCLNVSQTLVCNLIEGYKVYVGLGVEQLCVMPVALKQKKGGNISSECEAFFVK